MANPTRKDKQRAHTNQPAKTAPAPAAAKGFDMKHFVPALLVVLYLMVELIPRFGAADVMAPQWIYLSILNLVSLVYIFRNRDIDAAAIMRISRNALSLIYLALFLLAGLSFFYALNRDEFLVNFSRFIITIIAFFCIALLLYQRLTQVIRPVALVLTAVLFIQSLGVLQQFFSQLGEKTVNDIIFNLKGNSGNKNILAVGMALKIPFAVYCLYSFRSFLRYLFPAVILMGTMALFFVNARATFLALLFQLVLYVAYEVFLYVRQKDLRRSLMRMSLFLLPVVIAFVLSTLVLNNAVASEQDAAYGSVTERLGTISLTEEGTNGRLLQWKSAIDFIGHHPLTGCGYGNWKLASIPYERSFVNELLVTYHVHNDLLELTAELGWMGGLLFLALFACAVFFLVRSFLSATPGEGTDIVIILLATLATYFNDAMFNFPLERPAMQLFLVFLLAGSLTLFLRTRGKTNGRAANKSAKWIFTGMAVVLLVPAVYASFQVYRSMEAQYKFNDDMLQEKPRYGFEEVNAGLPSFPNLNAFCFPVSTIKARYLEKEGRYAEALAYLRSSDSLVPELSLNSFFKGRIHLAMNHADSAYFYARQAFAIRPRSMANYQLLLKTAYLHKDTAAIGRAFREFTGYRKKEAPAWKEFISYMSVLTGRPEIVKPWLDSADRLFPSDTDLKKLRADTYLLSADAQEVFNKALASFAAKNYEAAIAGFRKVTEMNPQNFSSYENIGMSYFAMNRFSEAIPYFDQVIRLNVATDGKSEFFKALSLSRLGRNAEACPFLKAAEAKGYPETKPYMVEICGKS